MAVVPLFDPAIINRLVAREKVTAFVAVPTMLVALLENLAVENHDMSSMEMVISGGSMVAPELAREVLSGFDCGLQTVYGQTECCPIITHIKATTASMTSARPRSAVAANRRLDPRSGE